MADVDFPSPSNFLDQTPTFDPPCPSVDPRPVASAAPAKKVNAISKRRLSKSKSVAENKPKQTKSRDGCSTCKEKRLKCDETHPHCLQCQKRKVECGGYKKTFTFRTVQKDTFPLTNGPARPRRRTQRPVSSDGILELVSAAAPLHGGDNRPRPDEVAVSSAQQSPTEPEPPSFELDADALHSRPVSVQSNNRAPSNGRTRSPRANANASDPPQSLRPSSPGRPSPSQRQSEHTIPLCSPPLQSPNAAPQRPPASRSPSEGDLGRGSVGGSPIFEIDGDPFDDLDDIVPPHEHSVLPWTYPTPPLSQSSTPVVSDFNGVPMSLSLPVELSGVLHTIFHQETSGILSIKNGPGENPWLTYLWPMVFEDEALHYAVLSMTAAHASSQIPEFRDKALELQTKSVSLLRSGMQHGPSDTTLATALVLAFSESWHSHIYAGIIHLRAARTLISEGLREQEQSYLLPEQFERLQFLRSTWVYMDVIARLTALGGEESEDLDSIAMPIYGPEPRMHEIDPLMGCATTLFPHIGAIASLIKKIRKSQKSNLQTIAKAATLRDSVLKWQVPAHFVPPKDESLEIDHSRHTAEAYRWATILYLYQSVPMICTQEPSELAELTLRHLAAVPVSSRATIIHIFPLLAAGCEVKSADDREFVRDRWAAMMNRMCIGNLDRCWDVVKEVWQRRDEADRLRRQRRGSPSPQRPHFSGGSAGGDEHDRDSSSGGDSDPEIEEIKTCSPKHLLKQQRRASSSVNNHRPKMSRPPPQPPPQNKNMKERSKEQGPGNMVKIDPEMTVRGGLHWVKVMTERKWEILLG